MDVFASSRQQSDVCLMGIHMVKKQGCNAVWPHKLPPVSWGPPVLLQEEEGVGGLRAAPCWQWGVLVWHIQPGHLDVPSYPASPLAVPRLSCQFPGCPKLSCQSPGCSKVILPVPWLSQVILPVPWLSHHRVTPPFRSFPRFKPQGWELPLQMRLVQGRQRVWLLWCLRWLWFTARGY